MPLSFLHLTLFNNNRTPKELCTLVRSYAKLSHQANGLFEAVAKHANRIVQFASPKDLADITHAFSKLGAHDSNLFVVIAKHSQRIALIASTEDLSTLGWAFAKSGCVVSE